MVSVVTPVQLLEQTLSFVGSSEHALHETTNLTARSFRRCCRRAAAISYRRVFCEKGQGHQRAEILVAELKAVSPDWCRPIPQVG